MLVVFLGNPGPEYKLTRHNSGFIVAENMALTQDLRWSQKFFGMFAKQDFSGRQHCFLKPETFMNLSGKSVQAAKSFFKLSDREIVVVHDDIETEFGVVAFREGGGFAGHNGLKSIANSIGSPNFLRIKIGVGRPKKGDVSSFVLGKFTPEEIPFLPVMAEAAEEKLKELLQ
ncbi:aminoacyl-tRNA hydrolase [bacterium]|nr:aminoacyl-tRNA hydrolase [bacterium]